MHPLTLDDNTIVTVQRTFDQQVTAYRSTPTTVVYQFPDWRCELQLRRETGLQHAAMLAGVALAQYRHLDLALLVALAYTAKYGRLPNDYDMGTCKVVAGAAVPESHTVEGIMRQAQIRALVQDVLQPGRDLIVLPDHPWNTARAMIALGEAAWELSGAAAWWWGTYPYRPRHMLSPDSDSRAVLSWLASLALMPPIRQRLPIRIAEGAEGYACWHDWMMLAAGSGRPRPELRPDGLGMTGNSLIEQINLPSHLRVSAEVAQRLDHLTKRLLAESPRPVPHYLSRVLDVAVPGDLLPHVAAFGIAQIRMQPEAGGMYIALLDEQGYSMGATWWPATIEAGQRVPGTIPEDLWRILQPVLAGLWRDLCYKALHVPTFTKPSAHRVSGIARPQDQAARRKRRVIRLPAPARSTVSSIVWATDAERTILQRAVQLGHDYRPLPAGWEDRQHRADFKSRQKKAAVRAEDHGTLAPPPGFTYVKPYVRGAGTPADPEQPSRVAVMGLFAVALTFQDLPIAAEETVDE